MRKRISRIINVLIIVLSLAVLFSGSAAALYQFVGDAAFAELMSAMGLSVETEGLWSVTLAMLLLLALTCLIRAVALDRKKK